ncbi:MAG TPA: ABC transporter permease [Gemmatimonadaceae bacterium]|nr:ABC transporter permease [Gemmatimonadaceae bacterium]
MDDIRYSLRRLRNSPGFTLVVVLTLALGIGANTAIFSVVNAVLLRPLPYRDPGQLVTIEHYYSGANEIEAPVSSTGFADYRDRTRSFARMAVESGWGPNLTGAGEPERLTASRVSGHFFDVLGVQPALGRTLRPDEDAPGHERVVVLSDGLWRRLYGADPGVVGRTMVLDGESHEVVGVMPPGFRDFFNRRVELWRPLALPPEQYHNDQARTNEWLNLTARLAPGVAVEQARTEMTQFAERLKRDYADAYPPYWTLTVTPLREQGVGDTRAALLVLLGAVGFVLLIACANVANLLLARGATRLKEVAVRSALGAGRWALVRQLLTESMLLAVGGGLAGLALAWLGVKALTAWNPANVGWTDDLRLDAPVLAFTLGVAALTGLLFGLVPSLQTARPDLQETLRDGGRGAHAERGGQALRRSLVVAEVALALMLLAGAGLLIKSFSRLQQVDPGFSPERLLTFNLALPQAKYPTDTQQIAFFDQLLPRLAAIPGVQGAGATSVLPFGGSWSTASFSVEGFTPGDGEPGPWGDIRYVSPGFLSTLRAPLLRGRLLAESDDATRPRVAVVDEELAKRFWPDDDPVGKRITFGDPDSAGTRWIEVVGVVGHTAHEGLDADRRVQVYLSYRQRGLPNMAVALRTTGDPVQLTNVVRRAVRELDPDQPISRVKSMDALVAESVGPRRLAATLLALFAGIALLMAAIGIYGVMSYSVAQRTRELGVRMALGARRRDVLAMVVRQGMGLVLLGVGIGVVGALALARLIASQLYAVRPTDPVTFLAVAVLLAGIALVATLVPALRATRLDPVVALRQD